MKISTLLFAAAGLLFPAGAFAQASYDFEQGGLYYKIAGEEVRVVKPATDYVYTASVTLPSKVTHEGTTYTVDYSMSSSAFSKSTITDFTLGEGWAGRENFFRIALQQNEVLKRVTLMAPGPQKVEEIGSDVAVGQLACDASKHMADCALDFDGTDYYLRVKNVNMFDSEGTRLDPCLWGYEGFTYPTVSEAGGVKEYTFNLGANLNEFYGKFGGVLQLGGYDLAMLYFKVDASYISLRLRIGKYQTGKYYMSDGIRYSEFDGELVVVPLEDGVYGGDIVVPSGVKLGERTLPVTRIAAEAFRQSEITSLTLPATIKEIGYSAAYRCEKLETVDLSACGNVETTGAYCFSDCMNLTTLKLPAKVSAESAATNKWSGCFDGCTELERVSLPEGSCFSGTFTGCTKLVNFTLLENTDKVAKFSLDPKFFRNDGTTRISVAPENEKVSMTVDGEGRMVCAVNKADLYEESWNGPKFNGTLFFAGVAPGYFGEGVNSLFSVSVPEEGTSGVESAVVADRNAPVEYFNLQGVRVEEPSAGLYIRRQGPKVEKVLLR